MHATHERTIKGTPWKTVLALIKSLVGDAPMMGAHLAEMDAMRIWYLWRLG
jgi:hypothetical protein